MPVSPASISVDDEMDATSKNPVQNNVIYDYINTTLSSASMTNLQKAITAIYDGEMTKLKNRYVIRLDPDFIQEVGLSLTEVDLPSLSEIPLYCFYGCADLETVNAPRCDTVRGSAFSYCSSLETVVLGGEQDATFYNATTIFQYCDSLTDVYLGGTGVWNIDGNVNAYQMFQYPDNSNPLKIHVPTSLLAEYRSSSKWGGAPFMYNRIVGYDWRSY